MKTETKKKNRKQIRIYIQPGQQAQLDKITKAVEYLSESDVVQVLMGAALAALDDIPGRLPLPLVFRVTEQTPPSGRLALNDAPIPKR